MGLLQAFAQHVVLSRPSRFAESIVANVVERLLPHLGRWDPLGVQQVEELKQAIKASSGIIDGYAIAKTLDLSYGWDVDAALVEILELTRRFHTYELAAALFEWRSRIGLQPAFKEGDWVQIDGRRVSAADNHKYSGLIVGVDYERVQYLVRIDELSNEPGRGNAVFVDWEQVKEGV